MLNSRPKSDSESDDNSAVEAADEALLYTVRAASRRESRKKRNQARFSASEQNPEKPARKSHNAKPSGKSTAKKAARAGSSRKFLTRHKKELVIFCVIFALLAVFFSLSTSIPVFVQVGFGAIGQTTYPSADADMLAAEARYKSMEGALSDRIDEYESTHFYDEYHFTIDAVGHDPHTLISAITAYMGGAWKISDAGSVMKSFFDSQYKLIEQIDAETRYRTETMTGTREYTDLETGELIIEEYEYEVEVPYNYYICTVRLKNAGLETAVKSLLNDDQRKVFEIYNLTHGNRPDLFKAIPHNSKCVDAPADFSSD